MSVKLVTPSAAAANPSHPEHARWVKEQTLEREVAEAKARGLTLLDAERSNARQLERLSNRRARPKAPAKKTKRDKVQKEVTHEQLAAAGITKKVPTARAMPPMPPCKLCRQCVWCKRTLRLSQIATRARQMEPKAVSLVAELVAIQFAAGQRKDYRDAIGRELPFSRLVGKDVDLAVNAGIEWVCDRSTSFMGQWR